MKALKVPTMRELQKAAAEIGAEAERCSYAQYGGRGGVIWVTAEGYIGTPFNYDRHTPFWRVRYLAGQHIEALRRMQEAGL